MSIKADWIAVDWGSISLRAWAMDAEGQDLATTSFDQGAEKLSQTAFEATLCGSISPWLADGQTDVIACGMVGSQHGWIDTPYAFVPCKPLSKLVKAPSTDPRLNVQIIGGISQAHPADVMHGEETQIAGFQKLNPNWDGVICLPGNHTKWVQVSAGEIVSFQTFMTGEMFALLSTSSILRRSVASKDWDQSAFDQAVDEAISRPESIAARLFGLRAEYLLNNQPTATARSRLSGLLIGAELAAAKPYWLGQSLAIIGPKTISDGYATALAAQHAPVTRTDTKQMTLTGLKVAYSHYKERQ
tara:strand:+ start:391 stop:1293 length:903 start_codon:yes stop_codon:yes gene_type:complete